VSIGLALWFFSKVGDRDKLALVYRRAARLGVAREWCRDQASVAVRNAYGTGPRIRSGKADDDDAEVEEWAPYWQLEEQFDRRLEWAARNPVGRFETISDDGVILTLDRKTVRRVIDAPIVDVKNDS